MIGKRNHTPEYIELMRIKRLGKNNPNYGKHHPDRAKRIKEKYGDDIFKIWASKTPNSGKYERTPEIRNKMSKSHIGLTSPTKGTHLTEKLKQNLRTKRLGTTATIETRKKMRKAHLGSKSHLWKGGISYEPYTAEFSELLKDEIRKRDNYECQLCHTPQNGMKLDIHHIDYDKKNSSPDNLISLCHICHIKTGAKRKYWYEYFTRLLKVRVKWSS